MEVIRQIQLHLFECIRRSCSSSCNDEENSPSGQIYATIDGQAWQSDQAQASIINGDLGLSGLANDGSHLSFRIIDIKKGNHNSTYGSRNAYIWVPSENQFGYTTTANGGMGTLELTVFNETDSLLSGVFEFMAIEPGSIDTVLVTEGHFTDIPYVVGAQPVGDNFLEVKIDGQQWEGVLVAGSVNGEQLIISATNTNVSRSVGLFLPSDILTGTYEFGEVFTSDIFGQYNPSSMTSMTSESGTLNITKHDRGVKVIEGTFSFEAADFFGSGSASLTEGNFRVSY